MRKVAIEIVCLGAIFSEVIVVVRGEGGYTGDKQARVLTTPVVEDGQDIGAYSAEFMSKKARKGGEEPRETFYVVVGGGR